MITSISQPLTERAANANYSQGRIDELTRSKNAILIKSENTIPVQSKTQEAVTVAESKNPEIAKVYSKMVMPASLENMKKAQIKPEVLKESVPLFEQGGSVHGYFRSNRFITDSGIQGSYQAMSGGQISFEAGGFKGILMPNGKAMAYNSQSGESYSMQVKFGKGEFSISNIEPLSKEPFVPGDAKPLFIQGQNPNIGVRYNTSGDIQVKFPGADGKEVIGKGFMSPNGIMILALSNGATVEAHYNFSEDGKLQIFSRRAIE
ncbi:MAG: hypothetical protein SGJ02_12625 [bacterium]|nr:hypothetical protein [bacterium]